MILINHQEQLMQQANYHSPAKLKSNSTGSNMTTQTRIEAFVYHPSNTITWQEKVSEAIIMPCDYIPLSAVHHGMLLQKRPGVIIPVFRRESGGTEKNLPKVYSTGKWYLGISVMC